MLRLVTAVCYGAALLLTVVSVVGVLVVERERVGWVLGGWVFCMAGLFAIGRLAHLARRDHDET